VKRAFAGKRKGYPVPGLKARSAAVGLFQKKREKGRRRKVSSSSDETSQSGKRDQQNGAAKEDSVKNARGPRSKFLKKSKEDNIVPTIWKSDRKKMAIIFPTAEEEKEGGRGSIHGPQKSSRIGPRCATPEQLTAPSVRAKEDKNHTLVCGSTKFRNGIRESSGKGGLKNR